MNFGELRHGKARKKNPPKGIFLSSFLGGEGVGEDINCVSFRTFLRWRYFSGFNFCSMAEAGVGGRPGWEGKGKGKGNKDVSFYPVGFFGAGSFVRLSNGNSDRALHWAYTRRPGFEWY